MAFPLQHCFILLMVKYFSGVHSGVVLPEICYTFTLKYFSPFAFLLDEDYWSIYGEVLKCISFSAYFSLYLENNYFGECSPCGVSSSACFVLMVKYSGGVHSRVVLLGIFYIFSPKYFPHMRTF